MSNPEDVAAVRLALTKLMAIADRLDTRNLETVQRVEAAAAALDQGANRLSDGAEQFAERAIQVIGGRTEQVITRGSSQAMGQLSQQLEQSAGSAQTAARAMEEQSRGLTSARRTLVWNGLLALVVGALLAAGGSAWIAQRSLQEIARADFGKDILQATQRGVITHCGDSLCARIGKKPRRYGAGGEYVLLLQ